MIGLMLCCHTLLSSSSLFKVGGSIMLSTTQLHILDLEPMCAGFIIVWSLMPI